MKSALPTTAQPALQKRRFSTDEEDSDDESAIVRPEDLVRRWGGVHVRGDSLEPVTARPLEVDQNARRRRRCGVAFAVFCITVIALAVAFPTVSRAARPLIRAAAYPVGAVCIVLVAAALLADVSARCCRRRRAAEENDRAAPLMPNSAADTEFF